MTLLTACQDAAVELSQPIPSSIATNTSNPFARELLLHANRAAVALMKTHDWRALTTLGTLTGDGSATSFALPTDYDRMPKKAQVHSTSYMNMAYQRAADLDEWLYLNQSGAIRSSPGNWVILGGEMQIFPAMPSTETAKFYYITKNIVQPASGSIKPLFTVDTDTFRLPERLLSLGIVWRWRAQKRIDFAAELNNYEVALSEEIGTDKGSRILTIGRPRVPADMAYPGVLGGPGGNTLDSDGWSLDEE